MPESDQPPERGRAVRRALKTRQRLLDSALSVFTRQGVDVCSIEDITELADVGKGTFYRHFTDKTAILVVLMEAALHDLTAVIRARIAGASSIPDALNRIQACELDWCQQRTDCFRLLLQVQASLVVRPQALGALQIPFLALVSEIEAMLRPLVTPEIDQAQLRQNVLAAISAPFGVLALQQALRSIEPAAQSTPPKGAVPTAPAERGTGA